MYAIRSYYVDLMMLVIIFSCCIFLLAGGVQGVTGFGSALVAIPLLSLVMDVKQAVPLAILNGLVVTTTLVSYNFV